jgi:hypothetical protein
MQSHPIPVRPEWQLQIAVAEIELQMAAIHSYYPAAMAEYRDNGLAAITCPS